MHTGLCIACVPVSIGKTAHTRRQSYTFIEPAARRTSLFPARAARKGNA
jgi:hypothetical protein